MGEPLPKPRKVVVVTGCSDGGIGAALCRAFAARGCRVFATSRRLESMQPLRDAGLEVVQLDVTSADSISSAVEVIVAKAGRVDVLVNNAGSASMGPLLELPMESVRANFDTNVFGALALTQALVPHMLPVPPPPPLQIPTPSRLKDSARPRDIQDGTARHGAARHGTGWHGAAQREHAAGAEQAATAAAGGVVVNVGSVAAWSHAPWSGAYAATKSALHSISHTLRLELEPLGVHVVLAIPGAIRSNFGANTKAKLPPRTRLRLYAPFAPLIEARATASQTTLHATPADAFAARLADAVLRKSPPSVVVCGHMSSAIALLRCLPLWLRDAVMRRAFMSMATNGSGSWPWQRLPPSASSSSSSLPS